MPPAVALAAVLVAAWALAYPRTPDLAAQVYRSQLFAAHGLGIWDNNWYGGHPLPAYSLLLGPLAWLLGLRLLGALSVLASVVLFERLARAKFAAGSRWGACAFAAAAAGDLWIGRLTFALGVALALAASLAFTRERRLLGALAAAVCAAASPVAGVLLAFAALTLAGYRREPRAALVLAAPAAVVSVALALMFGEGGFEPYPLRSFLATAAVVGAVGVALPREQPLLRAGAAAYLLACVLCLLVRSPMGSNIERYGVLLAAPLLLCSRRRPGALAASALALALVWTVWGPVRETLAVAGSEATRASYYLPVERYLASHAAGPVRLEVPLTRSHWEAALLAPSVSLARGWEKQLDERYDGVLLGGSLTTASYERWLHQQAVAFVALPDAALDPSSALEGTLIGRGPPFLREVFASAHWRVYAVRQGTPLVSGPGRLVSLGHEGFALAASAGGRFTVRVHFTRYWTVTGGSACVGRAPGGWTSVTAASAGTISVAARFSLAGALGAGDRCNADAHACPRRRGRGSRQEGRCARLLRADPLR